MDLYIIHFIFISLCAGGSYLYGFLKGEKSGSQRTVELFLDDNLIAAIVTPDKDIIPGAETLNPAYIIFDNYEIILQWNRSLRFSLAVCTLKNKFENEI